MSGSHDTALDDRHERAAHLKERIYVAFAALAVVLGLQRHHAEALEAILTLAVTILGLLLAVFTADLVAHIVVHERMLTRRELRVAAFTSFGAVGSLAAPGLFLVLALLGVWSTDAALRASAIALVAALVVVGWVAVRRLELTWWQRLVVLGAEAVLGVAVVGLQLIAHG
ncbi:hypothetical protein H4J02_13030 [Protaetiibacter sp. SSC-01]|uniref:hypothetical protein n=1 Tax=Protaetiibacter sp. SSC-01 TaxID=2759943 RepID=UPI0016574672|nr:hypothetical protein [Protaetiibacter sp. SSC-01]QNO37336.1 hypothetical protein H4J02_13030 [Protaetiibacter sp. SSC-01]